LESSDRQYLWDQFCLDQGAVDRVLVAAQGVFGFLVGVGLIYAVVGYLHRRKNNAFIDNLRRHWWLVSSFFSLVGMWSCLAYFIHFRSAVSKTSGDTNKDSVWTFGQVLALCTWAPVPIELVYIFIQGPKDALTGQIMEPFSVIQSDKEAAHVEIIETELSSGVYQKMSV
jgi:hypothetical protein